MYRSLLEQHGFHRRRGDTWRFGPPRRALRSLWTAVQEFLRDSEACRRPLTELYDRLRRPPFGIKDGPLPVIVVAALLARDSRVAVYERGSFVPAWTPSHAERLIRPPDGFEVRQCRIGGQRREVCQASGRDAAPFDRTQAVASRRCARTRAVHREAHAVRAPYAAGFAAARGTSGRRWSGLESPPSWSSTTFRRHAAVLRSEAVRREINVVSTTPGCGRSGTPILRCSSGRPPRWRII